MRLILYLCAAVHAASLPVQIAAQADPAGILTNPDIDLSDPVQRVQAVEDIRSMTEQRREQARRLATARGIPFRTEYANGRVSELVDFAGEELLFYTTHNTDASISTDATLHRSNYATDGSGITIGMWDGGSGRSTHQEFDTRMSVQDGSGSINHATHVGGTLAASGFVSSARGMAPAAVVHSYDWNSDTSEMLSRGATGPNQTSAIYLSNHSYGIITGWLFVNNGSRVWEWYGNGSDASSFEEDFGRYNSYSRGQDSIAYDAPYYLIFRSAGNERTDNPSNGQLVALAPGSSTVVSYNASTHPAGDGNYRNGFETIGFSALGKNVMTVGAVSDAVTSGQRDISKATMSSFSSWGPTDDGRIKPDIVANGVSLYSPLNGSDSAYGFYSGTSMATPNACGSAALLIEQYSELFPGEAMRAATLKGLMIHTADDLGNAGPDYKFGWGLMDTKAAGDLLAEHAVIPEKQILTEDQVNTSSVNRSYFFVWDGISPVRATLSWTDPPGSSTSISDLRSPRLVNNLDLKIIAPDGTEFFPYVMPFVGDWSLAAMNLPASTGINNTDNVEQVLFTPTLAGTYTVVVNYSGPLTNNAQNFSLILTGAAAEEPPPPPLLLQSVTPDSALQGPATLTLSGTSFTADTSVKLTRSGEPDVLASDTSLVGGELVCDFDLNGVATGLWSIVATNPDSETSTLTDAFTVIGAIWSESFDGVTAPAGWSSQAGIGSNSWSLTDQQSHSPTKSYYIAGTVDKTTTNLLSPVIPIPADATDLQFSFHHSYNLESRLDGGRLEFSADGGNWFDVTDGNSGASFSSNGYNTDIRGIGKPSGRNEFAGQNAWSGNSGGFIKTVVNLNDTQKFAGKDLQVRWRMATNEGTASNGWYVDSIALLGGGDLINQPPVIIGQADSSSTEIETDLDGTIYEIVRGTEVALTVTADDDGGENNLTYTWSISNGPGTPVFFTINGTNGAKQSSVIFEALGDYQITVTVADAEGLQTSNSFDLRVLQEASGIEATPDFVSLTVGDQQAFSASVVDQFGGAMASQPSSYSWSASGGGTIDSNGLFTSSSAGGPFVISAQDNGLTGTASVTVNPITATVSISNLNQIYDGTGKPVTATTDPAGLSVDVSYDGSTTAPTDAGSYEVIATIIEPNYQGGATDTLVIEKALATIELSNLVQTYDGSPKASSASTIPTGLAVDLTYNGSTTAPIEVGSYELIATVNETNFQGSAIDTLVIEARVYADWQQENFTEQEILDGLADPDANIDGDALPQLIEYALGTDPHVADHDVIRVEIQEFSAGEDRLMMQFNRPVGLIDITYFIEFCSNLGATWTLGTTQVTPLSETTETLTGWDSESASQHKQRFVRLRVE